MGKRQQKVHVNDNNNLVVDVVIAVIGSNIVVEANKLMR